MPTLVVCPRLHASRQMEPTSSWRFSSRVRRFLFGPLSFAYSCPASPGGPPKCVFFADSNRSPRATESARGCPCSEFVGCNELSGSHFLAAKRPAAVSSSRPTKKGSGRQLVRHIKKASGSQFVVRKMQGDGRYSQFVGRNEACGSQLVGPTQKASSSLSPSLSLPVPMLVLMPVPIPEGRATGSSRTCACASDHTSFFTKKQTKNRFHSNVSKSQTAHMH